MINALINGDWKSFKEDQLQPGSNIFNFETGLYETFRTIQHKPVFLDPHIKTTDYRLYLKAYENDQECDCFNAVLYDYNNKVLAENRSNIFWVKKNCIYTKMNDVLPGITRKITLSKSLFKIHNEKSKILDSNKVDKLFLSNNNSGIIPILKIDNIKIKNERVGAIRAKLLKIY